MRPVCTGAVLAGLLSTVSPFICNYAVAEPAELSIMRVTPSGDDVPTTRQIVLEFNRPVVSIGKMDRTAEEVGVTISPNVTCQWRWLNTSSLACQLGEKDQLKKATRYQLHIDPKITANDGGKLSAAAEFDFMTERPDINYTDFQTWKAPSSPVIRLVFTQAVTKTSVEQVLSFIDKTSGTAYPVKVTPDDNDRQAPVILPIPHEKKLISFAAMLRKNDNQTTQVDGVEARRIWVVEPQQLLPENADMALRLLDGLRSAEGPELGEATEEVVTFRTFPAPKFVGVRCVDNNDNEIIISPDDPADKQAGLCNPLRSVSLRFATPVMRSVVKDSVQFTPPLNGGVAGYNPWGDENRDYSRLTQPYREGSYYDVWLPVGLKAAQTYTLDVPTKKTGFIQTMIEKVNGKEGGGIADEFGRSLPNDIHMTFKTDHRVANYEMIYNNALLEKGVDSDIPLYVNNLSATQFDFTGLTSMGVLNEQTISRTIPPVEDVQFAVPMGLRDMLGGVSGALYGHLRTTPDTAKAPESGRLFAQVTPFQVDFKLGHFSSLLWVVDLATGQPVKDAKISIYKGSFVRLTDLASAKPLITATSDVNGISHLPGSETLDPENDLKSKWRDDDERLFVKVEKDGDMALLPIANFYEVSTSSVTDYKVYSSSKRKNGHMQAWGMTAQGIYRAGDQMQYKIYVRDQDDRGFIPARKSAYTLTIKDSMANIVDTVEDITLDEVGSFSGTYDIPKDAPVGWYYFSLATKFHTDEAEAGDDANNASASSDHTQMDGETESEDGLNPREIVFTPMSVLVSDFTPAPFRVTTEIKGTHFKAGDELGISTLAQLHSGGPYTDAAARVTATLEARDFTSEDKAAEGFQFDSFQDGVETQEIYQKAEKINDQGTLETKMTLPDVKVAYGVVQVESAVQDDRGKSVASSASATYAGVDRLVGLKSSKWVFEQNKPATIDTLVVDDAGKPVGSVPVKAIIEREEVVTSKVKGAGNAYLSDVTTTWNKVDECALTSGVNAIPCTFTPKSAGSYRLTATIKDTKGRDHQSQMGLWVTGQDYVQWNDQNAELALPIIPEKKEWKVGDTARYLVKNPFPGVKALVTVERYGVMDSFVTTLEGSTPIISIPVKPDYVPGFYVSVTLLSPRVTAELPKVGQIDMGKPAFRMGYAASTVVDPYKQIDVKVAPQLEVYRPRDKVSVTLTATPKHPLTRPEITELAVAVLDDSVFDLIGAGRAAFDPYQGFYSLDNLDLRNYSLMSALVGRQKFEKKGANVGGDGGASIGMRNLFKFVSYWNPSVKLDSKGQATITFDAPDNLTGWRVLALATTPSDRMGLGEGTFKVNRPTELRSLAPNQVREGDKFKASFSVMNRTDKARTLEINLEASGDVAGGKTIARTLQVKVDPYKREIVSVPLDVALLPQQRDKATGTIHFKATAADAQDSDATAVDIPVLKARVVEVGANYATTTAATAEEHIEIPSNIFTDIGSIAVALSPSVIGNLEGAFRYIRDYNYDCWEQQLTKAVMAAQYVSLKPWMSDKFNWRDADKVTQPILDNASSYQAPNGGMAYFVASDDRADPYLSAYTALSFRWMKKGGYNIPDDVSENLDDYLLNFLRQDAAPDFYQAGMSSTVRAVALNALAQSGKITKDDVLRYKDAVPKMSLFGKAQFMDAAVTLKMPDVAKDTATQIFASGNETGGKFMFQETYDDGYRRILGTPLRDNCAILSAFARFAQLPEGRALIGDKPFKLVRAITEGRGNRDHWENTQENMFCMAALNDYAHSYEQERPAMSITAKLDGQDMGAAAFADYKDTPRTLTRDLREGDAGRKSVLSIAKNGTGRLYYTTTVTYASKDMPQGVNSGFDVRREYNIKTNGQWTLLKDPLTLKRGDVVRVDLFLSLPAARHFVVVNDPLPGGLETVNRDLKTASGVDEAAAQYDQAGGSWWFKFSDWQEYNASFWNFYHKELRNDSARFYADYLPAGNYHLSYVAQVIADGQFVALPTRAEEMYNADVYGLGTKASLNVDSKTSP